jgi:hypothetical protein
MKPPSGTKFIVGGHASNCGWQVSPWFEKYCDDAPVAFTREDGWPVALPAAIGEALRLALADYAPAPDDIEREAANICDAATLGKADERAQPTVDEIKGAKAQLEGLQALTRGLAELIQGLDRLTIEVMEAEGCDTESLFHELCDGGYAAGQAIAGLRPQRGGRPRKLQAAQVTSATAVAFRRITGRRPTFTTDTGSGLVLPGPWPDTLQAVFTAAWIDASVAAQVKAYQLMVPKDAWALSEKTPPWEA